MPAITSTTF